MPPPLVACYLNCTLTNAIFGDSFSIAIFLSPLFPFSVSSVSRSEVVLGQMILIIYGPQNLVAFVYGLPPKNYLNYSWTIHVFHLFSSI